MICAVLASLLSGCGGNNGENSADAADAGDAAAHAPPTAEAIRLLVVGDPSLAASVQSQWQGYAKSPLDIHEQTAAEFEAAHLVDAQPLDADAVIYPAGLIGLLAERGLIEPLPDSVLEGQQLDRPDLLALSRLHETMWGEQVVAVPFGSPQLVLMYRSDLFEKLGAEPPATWAEYQALAEKLADRAALGDTASPEGDWHATVEPLGPGWASQMLLARAGGYARRRNRYSTLFDYDSMQPQIDRPPFVRALEELVAAAKLGPKNAQEMTPHDARRELLSGRAAMAVCWPTRAIVAGQEPLGEPVRFPVRFAELPGSPDVYADDLGWVQRTPEEHQRVPLLSVSGRLGSVVKDSPRARSAAGVLAWLARKRAGSAAARDAGPLSSETTLYRASQLPQATLWIDDALGEAPAQSYADTVTLSHTRSTPLFSVRIPGRSRYLAALDAAAYAAIAGDSTPEAALHSASEKWREITSEFGLEPQKAAYLRSLGLEP
jgi:multiple sugar transport system substrate-binding protein